MVFSRKQKVLLVATLGAVLFYRRNRIQKFPRQHWVDPYFLKRPVFGTFHHAMLDLKRHPVKFYEYLRMDLERFNKLLDLIRPMITKFSICTPITAEERLFVTLRYLAHGHRYRSMEVDMRISHEAISVIVEETCSAIYQALSRLYLSLPKTSAEWRSIGSEFNRKYQIPFCLSAIDGKHVLIKKPPKSGSLYFNYKKTFSVVLMPIVDANYKVLYADFGSQGHNNDAGIFNTSAFRAELDSRRLNLPPSAPLPASNTISPHFWIGDGIFPLLPNLMKPIPGHGLSREERHYNYRISRARLRLSVVSRRFHDICIKSEAIEEERKQRNNRDLHLIDFVRQRPALFDLAHDKYKDAKHKGRLWEEIQDYPGGEGSAQHRFSALKTRFAEERRKYRNESCYNAPFVKPPNFSGPCCNRNPCYNDFREI